MNFLSKTPTICLSSYLQRGFAISHSKKTSVTPNVTDTAVNTSSKKVFEEKAASKDEYTRVPFYDAPGMDIEASYDTALITPSTEEDFPDFPSCQMLAILDKQEMAFLKSLERQRAALLYHENWPAAYLFNDDSRVRDHMLRNLKDQETAFKSSLAHLKEIVSSRDDWAHTSAFYNWMKEYPLLAPVQLKNLFEILDQLYAKKSQPAHTE